jgi:hypothetical protein
MDDHGRRVAQLEAELADAQRRLASQRQRVYGGRRAYDPIREAELQRALDGASDRLAAELRRG